MIIIDGIEMDDGVDEPEEPNTVERGGDEPQRCERCADDLQTNRRNYSWGNFSILCGLCLDELQNQNLMTDGHIHELEEHDQA